MNMTLGNKRTFAAVTKRGNFLKLPETYHWIPNRSLEIQFKFKFAINVYILYISLGIISSLCCSCSGKYPLHLFIS